MRFRGDGGGEVGWVEAVGDTSAGELHLVRSIAADTNGVGRAGGGAGRSENEGGMPAAAWLWVEAHAADLCEVGEGALAVWTHIRVREDLIKGGLRLRGKGCDGAGGAVPGRLQHFVAEVLVVVAAIRKAFQQREEAFGGWACMDVMFHLGSRREAGWGCRSEAPQLCGRYIFG